MYEAEIRFQLPVLAKEKMNTGLSKHLVSDLENDTSFPSFSVLFYVAASPQYSSTVSTMTCTA